MQHDALAFAQALSQFRFRLVPRADFHRLQANAVAFEKKNGPLLTAPEERTDRYFEDAFFFSDDDANFHAVPVAERARLVGVREIDPHVDPLFFDAERRHLHEPRRLDSSDA